MPRGTILSEFERGQIAALSNEGKKLREIARAVKRTPCVVKNYLENPTMYGKNHAGGREKALSERDERKIWRLASNSSRSVSKIKAEANVDASRWTVWRAIKRNPNLKRAKLLAAPKLTTGHKEARLRWAKDRIAERTDWTSVVFSDEKKFNLDGPDGYFYYWHDLRKDPVNRMSRVVGGGGVMLWACIGYGGVRWTEVHGRLKAADYTTDVLFVHLVPFGEQLGGPQWIFQQDNASIHEAAARQADFQEEIPRRLQWPSRSPDLNPTENLWGLIVKDVYAEGRQYDSVATLRKAINTAFERIDMQVVQRLIDSMSDRLFQVIKAQGGKTKY